MSTSIKTILLPTAFSLLSRRAAQHVLLLESKFNAEVHLLNVVEPTTLMLDQPVPGASIPMPVPGTEPSELLAQADRRLHEFAAEVFGDLAARVRVFSVIGGITDEIVRHAQQHKIDLIVMGTHADGALKRLVFGSVGRGVLEGAPCPVLLVPVRGAAG
ncbi:MAG: universal stress protein [Phycisphaeraceae bacterium]|nr:universal stress protein [Phycisphaeraceae bacterium]